MCQVEKWQAGSNNIVTSGNLGESSAVRFVPPQTLGFTNHDDDETHLHPSPVSNYVG